MESEIVLAMFGRFQPFTRAHRQMAIIANQYGFDYSNRYFPERLKIGVSETTGDTNNPLSFEDRHDIIERSLGSSLKYDIIHAKDPWKFLAMINDPSANEKLFLFCGDDQYKDYLRLADYNGALYTFSQIHVINCGKRDGKGIQSISATKARSAAKNDDIVEFAQIMSPTLKQKDVEQIFDIVQHAVNKQG